MVEGTKINRSMLIQQLVDEYRYTKKAATSLVDDFTSIVLQNLENGNSVSIKGFGSFEILMRKGRSFPNMKDGNKVVIPDHYIPRFYPWAHMKFAVKKWESKHDGGRS